MCQIISTVIFCNSSTIVACPTGELEAFLGGDNGSVQREGFCTRIFTRPPPVRITSVCAHSFIDYKSDMDLIHVSNFIVVGIFVIVGLDKITVFHVSGEHRICSMQNTIGAVKIVLGHFQSVRAGPNLFCDILFVLQGSINIVLHIVGQILGVFRILLKKGGDHIGPTRLSTGHKGCKSLRVNLNPQSRISRKLPVRELIPRICNYLRCFKRILSILGSIVFLGPLFTLSQLAVLASDVDEGDLLSDGFILEHGCESQVTLSPIGVPTVIFFDKHSQSFIGIRTLVGSDSIIRSSDTPAFEYLTGNRSNVLGGRRYNRLSRRKLNSILRPYRRTVVRIQERNQNLLLRPLRDVSSSFGYRLSRFGIPATKDVAFTSGITAIIECRRIDTFQQVLMNLILEDFLVVYAIGISDGVLTPPPLRLIVAVLVFRPDGIERGILINAVSPIYNINDSGTRLLLRGSNEVILLLAETKKHGVLFCKGNALAHINSIAFQKL